MILWLISVVPDASKELLDKLPGVETVEITAKYPIVEGEHERLFFFADYYTPYSCCLFLVHASAII